MARSKATAAAAAVPPAPTSNAPKDVVSKYQALRVSLDTLANAAHTASYATSQYMEAAFPGLNFGETTFFSSFSRGAATGIGAHSTSAHPDDAEPDAAEDGNPAKRRKRNKSTIPKDPNAPKKPLTAYFAFAKVARPEVVIEMPQATNKEITEELAARWAAMKETGEQQPFRDQYAIDMKAYNKLSAIYKAKLSGLPLPEEVAAEPEPEPEVEEEEEPAPAPKPVTPKSAKGKKEKAEKVESTKKKGKEKATPKEKSRKRSTKEVTPPPSAGEEEQPAPATKSPRKRKRKAAD